TPRVVRPSARTAAAWARRSACTSARPATRLRVRSASWSSTTSKFHATCSIGGRPRAAAFFAAPQYGYMAHGFADPGYLAHRAGAVRTQGLGRRAAVVAAVAGDRAGPAGAADAAVLRRVLPRSLPRRARGRAACARAEAAAAAGGDGTVQPVADLQRGRGDARLHRRHAASREHLHPGAALDLRAAELPQRAGAGARLRRRVLPRRPRFPADAAGPCTGADLPVPLRRGQRRPAALPAARAGAARHLLAPVA